MAFPIVDIDKLNPQPTKPPKKTDTGWWRNPWDWGIPWAKGTTVGETTADIGQKALYYGAGALEKLLTPATVSGATYRELEKGFKAVPPQGIFESAWAYEERLKSLGIERPRRQFVAPWEGQKWLEAQGLLPEQIEYQKQVLPGGKLYEEHQALPWIQQLKYETPFWGAMTLLPGATGIRSALAPAAARGGIRGAAATVARTALAPVAAVEKGTGLLIRGAIELPLKGVSAGARKVFNSALNAGLDRWMAMQGHSGIYKNKIIEYFLTKNNAWLVRQADANIARNLSQRIATRQTAEMAARIAAEDTIKQAEPLLLQAVKEVRPLELPLGVKPTPSVKPVIPETMITPPPATTGVPMTITKAMVEQLQKMGYPVTAIAKMTPEAAWRILYKPAIPKAEPGMPEAGYQPAAFGVTEKEVYPVGRGKLTQISLDDQLKLAEAREAELFPTRPIAEVSAELSELDAQIAGLKDYIQATPATKLLNLIKKTGWHKGEVSNLTLKQYRDITGKTMIKPSILTADKKHVRWEYALDDIATEMGYESGEALKLAIEDIGSQQAQLRKMGQVRNAVADELARAEGALVPPLVEATPVSIVTDLERLYSDIGTEIEAFQLAVKGLKGDEAKVARETLAGLQRELKYVERTLGSFEKRPDMLDATTLRQTIMAWARYKGLTQETLQDIFSSVAGRRQLSVIPQEQLGEILARVKSARPKRIKGKMVITAKTERKIQSLKASLTAKGQMAEVDFARIMNELKIDTPRYISQYRFPTESEAKSLIRAMLDDAEWIGQRSKVTDSLAKHPEIAERVNGLNKRIETKRAIVVNGEPVAKVNAYQDMRYYTMSLESKTRAPFYRTWQWLNNKHLENRYIHTQYLQRLINSTPDYGRIAGDEQALKRVSDYIASKHRLGPKAPLNITVGEIRLANEIEAVLLEFRNTARLGKFDEGYDLYGDDIQRMKSEIIPDAPAEDLRRAVDIYESRGRDALIEYLNTRTWGVIKSGYEPLSVVNPKIYLFKVRPMTLGKGHIRVRHGVQYAPQDRNILQRFSSYTKQMLNLNLAPPVRKLARVFDESIGSLEKPAKVAEELARDINEMKGYSDIGGPMAYLLSRVYSQTMAAVFWDPFKWLRNKCQNLAFHPDRHRYFMPSTWKPLPEQDLIYFETYISQMRGMQEDYMMRSFKAFPGLGRLTRLANKTSLYPLTDQTNRLESYQMRKNRVNEALAKYEKDNDIDKLIDRAGLADLEPIQQREALELLAQETVEYPIAELDAVSGKEAFARYNAKEVTNNTHFMYERSQRSPAEMGPVGRILGNLFAFPRSYAQRIIFQGRKLVPGSMAGGAEKWYALRTILGIIICGMLIGEAFKKVTGRKYNPYNPVNILSWAPGGLTIGAAEDISTTMYDIAKAVTGDGDALSRVTSSLPAAARLTIPFYRQFIYLLETATDKKNIDRYALRKLRAAIDREYEPRESAYEMERNFFTMMQHALFGGELEKPDPYQQIEDEVWSQYPSSYRRLSDRILQLEKTDPREARRLLFENPQVGSQILEARRKIAIAKAALKRKEAIEEREKVLAGR